MSDDTPKSIWADKERRKRYEFYMCIVRTVASFIAASVLIWKFLQ